MISESFNWDNEVVKILKLLYNLLMNKDSHKEKKAKVVVFNQELDDDRDEKYEEEKKPKRVRRSGGSFVWGFFLIFVGTLLFLNVMGLAPWTIWEVLSRYWPLILVFIGLDVILGRSGFSNVISFIIAFAFFATILGAILVKVFPQAVVWLPREILNYLNNIGSYINIQTP